MKKQLKCNKEYYNEYKLHEYWYHLGLFDYSIIIAICDENNISKYVEKRHNSINIEPPRNAKGVCYRKDGRVPIIWLPKKPKLPSEIGTLAHEILHALVDLSKWSGISINDETEEVFAHGMSTMVANILEDTK